ncbi:MAG: nickel pincer cofactor biosynthesis protein LarC [Eubacteriales bacterium]|nr:nickel pincer cofactor biosynthesis protein LarC [Eubacteriales bacterium]
MKKILYFDCSSGISGDMTLGALLGLTEDPEGLVRELEKLHLPGYHMEFEQVLRSAVTANHVNVVLEEEHVRVHETEHDEARHGEHHHGHSHEHEMHTHDHGAHAHGGHAHRSFRDIRAMIEHSTLDEAVKDLALRIFLRVAKAEAKVHGKSVDEVQFHEVGAVDSIVDIVGCAILIHQLQPDRICSSVIHEGHGFIRCQHGMLSVPVPAVSEIFAEAGVSVEQIDINTELVTPTGAAIIAELTSAYGAAGPGLMPQMRMKKIGWGAGTKVLPIPNLLKAVWGETEDEAAEDLQTALDTDEIAVLETNLDDCTGEMLGFAMERLLKEGALDVFYTPIYMKKNRPAYLLSVLARPQDVPRIEALLFKYTTTIGVRKRLDRRVKLKREKSVVQTPYGELTVKKVLTQEGVRMYPEYDSAVLLANSSNRSLWEIYQSYESMGEMVSPGV